MKQILFFLCIASCIASCTTDPPPPPAATFVSIATPEPAKPAANVGVTSHGVTAYYLDSGASFYLYFNQCCELSYDGNVQHMDCEVYQTSPGVYVGDFGRGEFVKINTMTGTTTIYKGGVNRIYRRQPTP